mgnify:CR=1 FL=1
MVRKEGVKVVVRKGKEVVLNYPYVKQVFLKINCDRLIRISQIKTPILGNHQYGRFFNKERGNNNGYDKSGINRLVVA